MKGLLLVSCLLVVLLSETSTALNCNGCTFHRSELADTLNCNVSYTCSPEVTSCETIVTKEDGEYLIIFGCGVGYCKDANRVNEGLDKCSESDKCYQCCNQDSCNSVADFSSFAEKTINVQVEPEGGEALDKESKVIADSVNADASKNAVAQDSTTAAGASTSAGSSTASPATTAAVVVESKESQGDGQIKDFNAKQLEESVENAEGSQTPADASTASTAATPSISAAATASTVAPISVENDDDGSDSDFDIENTTERPGDTTKDELVEGVNKNAAKFEEELESVEEEGSKKSDEDNEKEIVLDDDLDDIMFNDDAGNTNGLEGDSSSTAGVETSSDSTSATDSATTESPSSATSQFGYFKLILITISLIIATLN